MFRKRKNRESGCDLSDVVKDVVKKICEWTDGCGSKFAIETKTKIGEDFVLLDVFGVDELFFEDLFSLAEEVPAITEYSCRFSHDEERGAICFVFENADRANRKKAKRDEQCLESKEEIEIARCCFQTLKTHLSEEDGKNAKFTSTSTPGLIVVTTHNLSSLGPSCCEALKAFCKSQKIQLKIYLDKGYVQFNINKIKKLVNI